MKYDGKAGPILVKALKVIGWTVLSVIMLLLLVAVAVQIPAVQQEIKNRAITFLREKIKTEVRLDHISIAFPKKIVLTGLYLEDQSADTLLYAGELSIDTDLFGLTKRRIELNDISFEQLRGFVSRSSRDSAFNFDYIINAFNDTTASVPDTTAAPWEFSIGDVSLDNARLVYVDELDGNDIALTVGSLSIDGDEFDLSRSVIHVDGVVLSDVNARVVQSKLPPRQPVADTVAAVQDVFPYDLAFSEIRLQNIKADYTHTVTGKVMRLDLASAEVDADEIDLKKQVVRLDKFSLSNTFLLYHQMSRDSMQRTVTAPDTTASAGKPWTFALDRLDLEGNSIQYYDFNSEATDKGIDRSRLWLSDLSIQASDLKMAGMEMSGELEKFSLRERSGFTLLSFTTSFQLQADALTVDDFRLETLYSTVAMDARLKGDSISTWGSTYPEATVEFNIRPSSISFRDVSFFAPLLMRDLPINFPAEEAIEFSLACHGLIRDLKIDHIRVATLHQTILEADGTIRGLPDARHAIMRLHLAKFYTTRADIERILPKSMLPESIALPAWINVGGDFSGTMVTPAADARVSSAFGSVSLAVKMNLDSTVRTENYTGKIGVEKFALGKLLKQEATIGLIDLEASVSGSGLKLDDLDALADLTINEFQYNNYTYRGFNLHGAVKQYFFSGTAALKDENLDFVLKGDLDYNEDVPRYKLDLDLKNADFKALRLMTRELKARAMLNVDLATSDFRVMNGNVGIRNVAVFNGEALYTVDSLLFASLDQEGRSELSIRSDIITGDFKGTLNLFSLPEALKRHFNNYFSLRDTAFDKPLAPQNFKFSLVLKNTDLLTEVLLPDLEPFVPGEIAGEFNSAADDLDLRIGLSEITYGGISLDSMSFKMDSDKDELRYLFSVRGLAMDTLSIAGLRLTGNVADDSIRTRLSVIDEKEESKYIIGGVINSFKEAFQFRFVPEQLVFNYEDWDAPDDNYLLIGKGGLQPNHFELTRGETKISLVKRDDQDSTLSVVFQALDLKSLTSLVSGTTPASGTVDGDLNISVAETGAFNSNVKIHRLNILEQEWGELTLAMGKPSMGPFNVDLRIEGDNAELKAAGYFVTKDNTPEIHFQLDIPRLNLAVVEPLSMGQAKNVTGQLTGSIKVDGPTQQPDINGEIIFKEAQFLATYVNSEFILKNERIGIRRSGISFDDFKIRDRKNNVASIDGEVKTGEVSGFDLNLMLKADNFQLLNSTARDNDLIYGNVRVNTRTRIRGTSTVPKVNMSVSLSDESDFTYVVPQSEKGILEQKGIVVFVDKDAKDDPFLSAINPNDTVKASFRGIELTANVELSDEVTFNIVIDPVTGDRLSVKGNSTLSFAMDQTGDMELSGRYEVSEGTYDMSFYKIVKRQFTIEKGGTITWSGEPLNAMLDLRAGYEVETAPLELMSSHLPPNDASLNMYKRDLPFIVYLQIEGELLAPEISFQLDMPPRERNSYANVYARIQDINTRESDLNKQVFALLVLKRFISENPFDSQGGGMERTARRSVSRLLTEQLNRLSENVKGVELSFDVKSYEDYSTGQAEGQTALQLGVSKSLLDDRLVVKVSGNVDVEGDASEQRGFADYIGDLALEYKLTEDGRFRITGFRNSDYDMIDGELTETGAGLIYIKDYDTLRELFKSNEKEK
ncbi:MAG TPA: translocation/assembly module TamB domain-containing protein [Ohtaekwangia sp.]|nr:translocation/assembly module TamB domain-containing protein [Ohtaekwangia sp.]